MGRRWSSASGRLVALCRANTIEARNVCLRLQELFRIEPRNRAIIAFHNGGPGVPLTYQTRLGALHAGELLSIEPTDEM